MNRGAMRHRVTLEGVSTTVGDGGRKTTSYPAIATVWASIDPRALVVERVGDKLEFPVGHTITVPFAETYKATRRVTLGARIFWVRSLINAQEEGETLVFKCEEKT